MVDCLREVVLVTRLHSCNSEKGIDLIKVHQFVDSGLNYSGHIIICVDIGDDLQGLNNYQLLKNEYLISDRVTILPITVWGKFTIPLNIALWKAVELKVKYIVYQSVEFLISAERVEKLVHELHKTNTLVVGPAIEGHEFSEGEVPLRGRTCPWNTMAIWNVHILALTGFPMIGDGMNESWAGVEEVSTVTLLQHINPSFRAVLVQFIPSSSTTNKSISNNTTDIIIYASDIINKNHHSTSITSDKSINHVLITDKTTTDCINMSNPNITTDANNGDNNNTGNTGHSPHTDMIWSTDFHNDIQRQEYHTQKMLSKDTRPQQQLDVLNIPIGTVHHITISL